MPKKTPEQDKDLYDALTRALKRMDKAPPGTTVTFTEKEFGASFLRALQARAEECRAPYVGAHDDFTIYRVVMHTRVDDGKRVPDRVEITYIWQPHPRLGR